MEDFRRQFQALIQANDKLGCIHFAVKGIEENLFSVIELYETIMTPTLQEVGNEVEDEILRVWQEHVYSAIVRSVIENCYPLLQRESSCSGKAMVFCPIDELHEIGARMVCDYFELLGLQAYFVGSNTPKDDFINAIKFIKPDYVAISVSNFYHLSALQELIQMIKVQCPTVKIIVGGSVFAGKEKLATDMGATAYASSYASLKELIVCSHSK